MSSAQKEGDIQHIEASVPIAPIFDEAIKEEVKGVDDGFMFAVTREDIVWTREEERRLVRKIDMRMIPLVMLISFRYASR
jgi:hypothetical protein